MVRTYMLCVRAKKTLHDSDSINILSADIESVSTHSLHLATALASSPFLYLFTVALNAFPCVSLVPSSLTLSMSPYRNHTDLLPVESSLLLLTLSLCACVCACVGGSILPHLGTPPSPRAEHLLLE